MNVENLIKNHHQLIIFMENAGYSKPYTAKVRRQIRFILAEAGKKKWNSYDDVYHYYAEKQYSTGYLHLKRVVLGLIQKFDTNGQYPDRQQSGKPIILRNKRHLLADEFKAAIDYYCAAEKKRGIKDSTIYGNSSNAASFLFSLQEKEITTLEAITEKDILAVFVSTDGNLKYCYGYKKNIASVFKACIPQNPELYTRLLTFLPAIKNSRKNTQYLLPEDVGHIKQALSDENSTLTLRDKAIGILALYTGLRSCDIAGLRKDSIDWVNDLIIITQQKTESSLELPLITVVGNAIYDYMALERPETDCEYIFVSYSKPYRRLKADSLTDIAVKIMDSAGMRKSQGSRGGFRIFRHRLATELLGNGIAEPIISRILGHTSPDSLAPYLSADFQNLKKCALSINRFPMSEGVFENV
jgi:integrase